MGRNGFRKVGVLFVVSVLVLTVVVCLVVGLVSFASATVIFSDGFESGNFSAWTDIYGSPHVVSDMKYAGSYGAFVNASGTHTSYYGADSSTGWGNHLFARGYYKFDVTTADWSNRGFTYVTNWTGSDDAIAIATLTHREGNDYLWAMEALNGTDLQQGESSTFSLNTSVWYCVEVEVFVDGSAGYAKMYVDDVLVASLVGVDNNKYGNPNHVGFGQLYDSRNGEAVWWDCCVIADLYIGPETIIPEFQPLFFLPLFMMTTLLAAFILTEAKRKKRAPREEAPVETRFPLFRITLPISFSNRVKS